MSSAAKKPKMVNVKAHKYTRTSQVKEVKGYEPVFKKQTIVGGGYTTYVPGHTRVVPDHEIHYKGGPRRVAEHSFTLPEKEIYVPSYQRKKKKVIRTNEENAQRKAKKQAKIEGVKAYMAGVRK